MMMRMKNKLRGREQHSSFSRFFFLSLILSFVSLGSVGEKQRRKNNYGGTLLLLSVFDNKHVIKMTKNRQDAKCGKHDELLSRQFTPLQAIRLYQFTHTHNNLTTVSAFQRNCTFLFLSGLGSVISRLKGVSLVRLVCWVCESQRDRLTVNQLTLHIVSSELNFQGLLSW